MRHSRFSSYIIIICVALLTSACTDEVGLDEAWYPWLSSQSYSVSTEILDFPCQAGSKTLTIDSDIEWVIKKKPSFVTISPMSGGKGTTEIVITAEDNAMNLERDGIIEVAMTNLPSDWSLSRAIFVSQEGETITKKSFIVNNVVFTMINVKGGTFTMGATSEQADSRHDMEPMHQVTLNSYMIGRTEVTQELWKAVMGQIPYMGNTLFLYKSETNPIVNVSWNDCQDFISKLNSLTGQNFRLPTEAEWEYAARGGNKSKGYQYSGSNNLGDVGWFNPPLASGGNSGNYIQLCATRAPNELGIYDMSGNVQEWCQDWYGSYRRSIQMNPQGPSSGSDRVVRGGDYMSGEESCRSASRSHSAPVECDMFTGLRLALSE